jgi:NADPH2:quinone reductase
MGQFSVKIPRLKGQFSTVFNTQFAGARVIGAIGSANKAKMLRNRNVNEIINYNEEDYGQRVLELTDNRGADVIIDVIGAIHWPHYVNGLRAGGRIVKCGTVDGRHPKIDIIDLIVKQMAVYGSGGSGSKLVANRVVSLLNAGHLYGHIDRVIGLTHASEAHQAISAREIAGKIVLIV